MIYGRLNLTHLLKLAHLCVYYFIVAADNERSQALSFASKSFISNVEHIKQQIARENIGFVRFEATDLHGVSRSKTVPARFFHVNVFKFLFFHQFYAAACNVLETNIT